MKTLFKKICLFLFKRQTLQRERYFYPLFHSLNGHKSQSWLIWSETRSILQVSLAGVGSLGLGAFPGHSRELHAWFRVATTAMEWACGFDAWMHFSLVGVKGRDEAPAKASLVGCRLLPSLCPLRSFLLWCISLSGTLDLCIKGPLQWLRSFDNLVWQESSIWRFWE